MKIVNSFDTILNFRATVKEKYGTVVHNFFKEQVWVDRALRNSLLEYIIIDDVLFMFKKQDDFKRLYYFAPNDERVRSSIELLNMPDCVVILEKIGKNISTLKAPGLFEYYGQLNRMTKQLTSDDFASVRSNIIFESVPTDIPDIQKLEHALCNKYIDEHLSEDEISDKRALVSKRNGIFSGFVLYTGHGAKASVLYFLTDKEVAIKGTGTQLMHAFFSKIEGAKFVTVWCREDNVYAERFYKKFGYLRDGYEIVFYYYDTSSSPIGKIIPLN